MKGGIQRVADHRRIIAVTILVMLVVLPPLLPAPECSTVNPVLQAPTRSCLLGSGPAGRCVSCLVLQGPRRLSLAALGGLLSGYTLAVFLALLAYPVRARRFFRVLLPQLQTVPEAPLIAAIAVALRAGPLLVGLLAGLFTAPLAASVMASLYERVESTPYFEYSISISGSKRHATLRHVLPYALEEAAGIAAMAASRAAFLLAGLCIIGACDPTRPGWLSLVALMMTEGYWRCCTWGFALTLFAVSLSVLYPILVFAILRSLVSRGGRGEYHL